MTNETDSFADWAKNPLLPTKGERGLIVGQTGSGKTTAAAALLKAWPESPVIIYDTKVEPKFELLPANRIAHDLNGIYDALDDETVDYVIFRPSVDDAGDPFKMDAYLYHHYDAFKGIAAYIDELYQFHHNARAGRGLVALYTRGRSRGITTIASTQQPRWISRFAISEANVFHIFRLNMRDHRKAVSEGSGMPEMPNPPPFHFWGFRAGSEEATLVKPVSLDGLSQIGYFDAQSSGAAPDEPEPTATAELRHIWI